MRNVGVLQRWQEDVECQVCMIQGRMTRGAYIRAGSSFSKQAARRIELGSSDVGGGVGLGTSRRTSPSVGCNRALPLSSWMSEREARLFEE